MQTRRQGPCGRLPSGGARTAALLAAALTAAALHVSAGVAATGELSVAAAASLAAAVTELARAFERARPGTIVRIHFAGSPTLVAQIREGAPLDVVALADEPSMQRLVDADAVEAPHLFARNRLAIVVARGNPRRIHTLADLARPGLLVALCAPAVPAGRYSREAFARAGVTPPPASEELDVKAVVTRVALGEADAGVVYATDVRAAGDAVEGVDLPPAHGVVARYPIATLREARDPGAAAAFVAFVVGEEGRAVLGRHGFLPP